MNRDVISRRAAVLADCTGLSHAQARRHLETVSPHSVLLPSATPAQALLERWVLKALGRTVTSRLFPWGIRRVKPFAEHLVLELEGDRVAEETAEALLPCLFDDGDVGGVPGLRVHSVTREGITLGIAGSPATVTLRGIRPATWHRAVHEVEEEAGAFGSRLCHRDEEWSEAERLCLTDVELLGERADVRMAASAWLPSGLLRRVGLLRALGGPVSVDSWFTPVDFTTERLIVEVLLQEPPRDAPRHHERFLELLTGPAVGMPLQLENQSCWCAQDPLPYSSCYLDLESGNGAPGALQLRLVRFPGAVEPERAAAQRKVWRPLRTLGRQDMAGRC